MVYVDLRGFTGFTESAEPEEVMSVLRQYHAELGRTHHCVRWNDRAFLRRRDDDAVQRARAGRESRNAGDPHGARHAGRVGPLSSGWRKRGHELGFGIGIAGGYATIGTIGFEQRLDYGAVGPACNLAARLCGEAKDTQILVAQRVFAKVEAQIETASVGELLLKGFQRPVPAYNVLGLSAEGLAQPAVVASEKID